MKTDSFTLVVRKKTAGELEVRGFPVPCGEDNERSFSLITTEGYVHFYHSLPDADLKLLFRASHNLMTACAGQLGFLPGVHEATVANEAAADRKAAVSETVASQTPA
jgi:hypothetical protein